MDLLIVGGVFLGLGLAIISKLKQQNHPAYKYVSEFLAKQKQKKEMGMRINQQRERIESKWF